MIPAPWRFSSADTARLVLAIARGIVRDSGEAEDVVQEAFFYLYKKSMLFDEAKGSAKNWITQIALHGRWTGSRTWREGAFTLVQTSLFSAIFIGGHRSGSGDRRQAQPSWQLERAFEQLPEMQRATLELFYFEGLDLREISKKLNQPLGNSPSPLLSWSGAVKKKRLCPEA